MKYLHGDRNIPVADSLMIALIFRNNPFFPHYIKGDIS